MTLPLTLVPTGYFCVDAVPRIGQLLLEAEADAFLFAVDVEHDDVDVLADLEQFATDGRCGPSSCR